MRTAKPKAKRPSSGWEDRHYSSHTHPIIPAELGRLPSVTTITGVYPKPWMMPWITKEVRLKCEELVAKIALNPGIDIIQDLLDIPKVATRKRDTAAALGNVIHDLIHLDLTGKPVPVPSDDKVADVFIQYQNWKREVEFKLVDTEMVVWSTKYLYAGKLDTVGWVEGKLTLVDFKTSASIYREMACQIAAYAQAWTECTPRLYGADNRQIERLKIIRLGKENPEFEVADFSERWDEAFDTFLALKKVWAFDRKKV